MTDWVEKETSTHQEHVIAHVVGATVMGHFVFDETAYLLLDIGFIWNIYLDGEMGLMTHPLALKELSIDEVSRRELAADVDALMMGKPEAVTQMTPLPDTSPIQSIHFLARENSRRFVLSCERGSLVIEMSLDTREVKIMSTDGESVGLKEAANDEQTFIREHLKEELGREPTPAEINDWLRDHTESY